GRAPRARPRPGRQRGTPAHERRRRRAAPDRRRRPHAPPLERRALRGRRGLRARVPPQARHRLARLVYRGSSMERARRTLGTALALAVAVVLASPALASAAITSVFAGKTISGQ